MKVVGTIKSIIPKLMELDITVPAGCSNTRQEAKIGEGFSTPFTIFTKNGKVIDSICGYTTKSDLITTLKAVGMIETK